jgi:hypothetical protein
MYIEQTISQPSASAHSTVPNLLLGGQTAPSETIFPSPPSNNLPPHLHRLLYPTNPTPYLMPANDHPLSHVQASSDTALALTILSPNVHPMTISPALEDQALQNPTLMYSSRQIPGITAQNTYPKTPSGWQPFSSSHSASTPEQEADGVPMSIDMISNQPPAPGSAVLMNINMPAPWPSNSRSPSPALGQHTGTHGHSGEHFLPPSPTRPLAPSAIHVPAVPVDFEEEFVDVRMNPGDSGPDPLVSFPQATSPSMLDTPPLVQGPHTPITLPAEASTQPSPPSGPSTTAVPNSSGASPRDNNWVGDQHHTSAYCL